MLCFLVHILSKLLLLHFVIFICWIIWMNKNIDITILYQYLFSILSSHKSWPILFITVTPFYKTSPLYKSFTLIVQILLLGDRLIFFLDSVFKNSYWAKWNMFKVLFIIVDTVTGSNMRGSLLKTPRTARLRSKINKGYSNLGKVWQLTSILWAGTTLIRATFKSLWVILHSFIYAMAPWISTIVIIFFRLKASLSSPMPLLLNSQLLAISFWEQ